MSKTKRKHPDLPIEPNCFGCCACADACPTRTIRIVESNRGYLVPSIGDACIGCRKCESACPSLNSVFDNETQPDFYSFCANDEIRAQSTSGGVFTLLAEATLAAGGFVCGAVFDDQLQLHHVVSNDREIVMSMRGSKYVQSNAVGCYAQVKQLLEAGKRVLFTGTPCQVAALRTFIAKDCELLLTVDLICQGVPSQHALNKYLDEVSEGRKAVGIEFRNKRFGWSWAKTLVTFEDGSEFADDKHGPYKQGFSKRLLWRDSCINCKFATYPRQGDVTIGDLWGAKELDPASNDKKGTSLVFLNNDKGRLAFREITTWARYVKRIDVADYGAIPNRVSHGSDYTNPNRDRFLSLLDRQPFSKAVGDALSGHYDIGMPSGLFNVNLGGVLTYYALYQLLTDMGYSVLPLVYPKSVGRKPYKPAVDFCNRNLPKWAQPVQMENIEEMRDLNERCDAFVIGSDQYLLEQMCREHGNMFLLPFVGANKKKIAVSTSFGGPKARGSNAFVNEMRYYLNRFDWLSCREDVSVAYANSDLQLRLNARWVMDPILLCNPNHIRNLAAPSGSPDKHVGAYIIRPSAEKWALAESAKSQYPGLPLRVMGRANGAEIAHETFLKDQGITAEPSFPAENALQLIRDSQLFVTDSFHGVCLAIVFKVDFLVMPRDFVDRFDSILGRLGLQNRIVPLGGQADPSAFSPIDWKAVDAKLEALRTDGISFVETALNANLDVPASESDSIMSRLSAQEHEIKLLKKQLTDLGTRVEDRRERRLYVRLRSKAKKIKWLRNAYAKARKATWK